MTDRRDEVSDLFAGPGGWDVALQALGFRVRGVEWDAAASDTAEAAGHERIRADVSELEPLALGIVRGEVASPPCQGFSAAGSGRGRVDSLLLLDALSVVRTRRQLEAMLPLLRDRMTDHRSLLALEPLRYALARTPSWLAWEQVPAVLPLWEAAAVVLRGLGYSVATALLNAEQYGVPQTRRRAILVARAPWLVRELGPVSLPMPTHSRYHQRSPWRLDEGVAPWVSMADALGWGMTERPYPTLASGRGTGGPDREKVGGSHARGVIYREQAARRWESRPLALVGAAGGTRPATVRPLEAPAPAPALAFGNDWARWGWRMSGAGGGAQARIGQRPRDPEEPGHTITGKGTACWVRSDDVPADREVVRLTVAEAAALQTFPHDYPWAGSTTAQFRQVGDAVPPLLALHVVAAASGVAIPVDDTTTTTLERTA